MSLVLVIDDDAHVRRMVHRILSSASHTVIEAEDGEAGMALLRDKHPTIVITDVLMPKKEGIETIREIRQLSPDTKVIAISGSDIGSSGPFYLQIAKKLGADAILAKPFRERELLQMITRVLASA